ncbi:similar to Saccharomyces cerevisiae YDR403W DIT1 Sporulation-specific enzyme required for spore wall maturation [Maudiozyma saulgeensis]|uniref:Similar to Saccharomyces cerevisiae YDR403W DIT1 Sporulation-specific enzyme required for spore wall maturation n=1 Tax=Maudiozyma saulgeensis TaxID=1789683 RepID=A0A1X7R1U6_9SACH|nr:similar to Saccharomyces cerevisiae YDR403W DIT1 Sporulation-specific enzyme required for spore wall maturation [Kazachstania saulgeensis]
MTVTEKPKPIAEVLTASTPPDSETEREILHNKGKDISTFSRFLAIYTRNKDDMSIYCIEEKKGCDFSNNWTYITNVLTSQNSYSGNNGKLTEYLIPACDAHIFEESLSHQLKITEYQKEGETQIRGCIVKVEVEDPFNDWFIYHMLDQSRLQFNDFELLNVDHANNVRYHDMFADFFAANLKNTIKNDEWDESGREYFVDRVRYFTDRYVRIECILPAFPCKSSNINKVGGDIPDKGEELALRRLIQITKDVKDFYPPGLKIWIVSDGHVFSDCIGVDDDVVDNYTSRLHELYDLCKDSDADAIGFCGLNDLFFNGESSESFDPTWVESYTVLHYTGTMISSKSDAARQILMKGCDTDDGSLRKDVNIPDHPRLYLYRGFSKFMMEDLAVLPFFQSYSKKRFKKVISKIAFNMIRRNDAYSNLVELMFPHHMRISIHAHKNSGPKFGVKVISNQQCSIVKDLQNIEEPTFEDLLHIPTPWHNCVVKVTDSTDSEKQNYFLTKSRVIKDALASGTYKGEWKETCFQSGNGGCFEIMKHN